jgi:tRNA threonylcarbamoyladenosine biosynthesis protein TsaB
MALILNIDTATEMATVSISEKDKVLGFTTNNDQKDHASFLQPAIKELFQKADLTLTTLQAVAVTAGPGSYTGLRVGMASAKGLCYALNIPLILINTLEMMALSAINQVNDPSALYCPMIDARRMEVFTAVYDYGLKEVINPGSIILDDKSFEDLLISNRMYFTGGGSLKLENIITSSQANFTYVQEMHHSLALLSHNKYEKGAFSSLFYSCPVYLKEFYTPKING